MSKLGLGPQYSFSVNICFKFSAFCLCSVIPQSFLLQLLVHINSLYKIPIAAELAVHGRVVQGSALYQHSLSLRKLLSHVVGKQQPYAVKLGDPGSVLYYVQQGAGHSNHLSYILCRPFVASFSRTCQPSAV
jgi:hypothetical protein